MPDSGFPSSGRLQRVAIIMTSYTAYLPMLLLRARYKSLIQIAYVHKPFSRMITNANNVNLGQYLVG